MLPYNSDYCFLLDNYFRSYLYQCFINTLGQSNSHFFGVQEVKELYLFNFIFIFTSLFRDFNYKINPYFLALILVCTSDHGNPYKVFVSPQTLKMFFLFTIYKGKLLQITVIIPRSLDRSNLTTHYLHLFNQNLNTNQ